MAEVTQKIIDIQVNGTQTVKDLKTEIQGLRDKLLNVKEGSEEYNTVLNQLIEDEKKLTSVMQAGKKEVHAAAGSYNALQQEMTALKRVWKEVQDEASRNEIGKRINDINNQLKDMDASVGVFSRNVGDYTNSIVDASKLIFQNLEQISPAIGGIGGQVASLVPLIQKTVKTATTGLKGIKAAIAGTGIGLLVTALGLLVQNWDKVTAAIRKFIPAIRESDEATKAQVDANNDLLESNKNLSDEIDFQARVMKAQGATTLEVLAYKKAETEALLANTQAQIAETNAKIESLKQHSAWQRFWHGENKQIKELEESLKSLTAEQERLDSVVNKLGQDIVIENIELSVNKNATDATTQSVLKLVDAMKKLREAEKKEDEERERKKKEAEETAKFLEQLDKDVYESIQSMLDENLDAFLDSIIQANQASEQMKQDIKSFANSVVTIIGSVSDAWSSLVQSQVNAGKISEEEGEEQLQTIKDIETAIAIVNTIAAAVAVFKGKVQGTFGWGLAAGIAEMVATLTLGAAQVAKIQATTIGTKSVSTQVATNAAVAPQTEYTPNYYQNITNATETENLANAISQQPIWVSVQDINKSQNRVRVVNQESTF